MAEIALSATYIALIATQFIKAKHRRGPMSADRAKQLLLRVLRTRIEYMGAK